MRVKVKVLGLGIRIKVTNHQFCSSAVFLYYLKTSENHSGCVERDQLHKWVKTSHLLINKTDDQCAAQLGFSNLQRDMFS